MYYNIHTHHLSDLDRGDVVSIYNYLTFNNLSIQLSAVLPSAVSLSAGIHPWYVDKDNMEKQIFILNSELKSRKGIVALGECGLDKNTSNMRIQEKAFIEQIKLSETFRLPLIIHCVKAWEELLRIHKQSKPQMPWILHGYRGGIQQTLQLLKFPFYFSIGYFFSDAVSVIPYSRLFLETDEKCLSIADVYTKISKHLDISEDTLKKYINQNVSIFDFV